jgi:hypothetical protein
MKDYSAEFVTNKKAGRTKNHITGVVKTGNCANG